jgi:hypothetical protein
VDRLLDDATRLVLAWPGRTVPLTAPMAFWWDGRHVWMSTPGDSAKARALRRDPRCALHVGAPDGADPGSPDAGRGEVLVGDARVYHLGDPVGLAVHGGVLAAAQTALMVKQTPSMLGYVVDAGRIPARFLPTNRVLVRVTVRDRQPVRSPDPGPGIAPALPTEVPPEVRRLLAGRRRVVLALADDEAGGAGVRLLPATWGAGFALQLPEGEAPADGTPATAVLDHDPGFRPSEVAGVALSGTLSTAGPAPRLLPATVRWWDGFRFDRAELAARPADAIVLPD